MRMINTKFKKLVFSEEKKGMQKKECIRIWVHRQFEVYL